MSQKKGKQSAALRAVSYLSDGMIVGLGTGSTAYFAIHEIASRVSQGQEFHGVPTSSATEHLACELRIPLLSEFSSVDVTIDGADEIDPQGNLIKGGGGALTREKIVAAASSQEIIIADISKRVTTLGSFPLPVEVIPFGWHLAEKRLTSLGCNAALRRQSDDVVFTTDNGNLILDCSFNRIDEPGKLSAEINMIPGVVENGLFVGLTNLAIVGHDDGTIEEIHF